MEYWQEQMMELLEQFEAPAEKEAGEHWEYTKTI